MRHKYSPVGQFEITGGAMRVTDPRFSDLEGFCGLIEGCRPGIWDAAVVHSYHELLGQAVSMLFAKQSDALPTFQIFDKVWTDDERIHYRPCWEVCDFDVGVDSAMAGFFDNTQYQGPVRSREDHCRSLVKCEAQAGALPYGAVSASGLGDSCYAAMKHKGPDGRINAVALIYF